MGLVSVFTRQRKSVLDDIAVSLKRLMEDMKIDNLLHNIKDYGLYVRISNCLYQNGVKSVKQLRKKTARDLLMFPNFGKKSLIALERELHNKNFKLRCSKIS